MPVPLDDPPEARGTCVWRFGVAALGKAAQIKTLEAVHGLLLSLGSLSQVVVRAQPAYAPYINTCVCCTLPPLPACTRETNSENKRWRELTAAAAAVVRGVAR